MKTNRRAPETYGEAMERVKAIVSFLNDSGRADAAYTAFRKDRSDTGDEYTTLKGEDRLRLVNEMNEHGRWELLGSARTATNGASFADSDTDYSIMMRVGRGKVQFWLDIGTSRYQHEKGKLFASTCVPDNSVINDTRVRVEHKQVSMSLTKGDEQLAKELASRLLPAVFRVAAWSLRLMHEENSYLAGISNTAAIAIGDLSNVRFFPEGGHRASGMRQNFNGLEIPYRDILGTCSVRNIEVLHGSVTFNSLRVPPAMAHKIIRLITGQDTTGRNLK